MSDVAARFVSSLLRGSDSVMPVRSVFFPGWKEQLQAYERALLAGDTAPGALMRAWMLAQLRLWLQRTRRKRLAKKIMKNPHRYRGGPIMAQFWALTWEMGGTASNVWIRSQLRTASFASRIMPPIVIEPREYKTHVADTDKAD